MDSGTATQPGDALGSGAKVSIASQYAHCKDSFQKLLRNLNDQAVAPELSDEFGRFKVWAGNAGAHRNGKVSLDYRLREAPHIDGELTELLGELNKVLEEALKLNEGIYSSHLQVSLPEEFKAELGSLKGEKAEPSEFEYLVLDIKHIITCFYKLSIAIRNPAPEERLHKIALIDMSSFENWDINYVDEKFHPVDPQNKFRVAKYLTERLGKANTRRRQFLKYYEAHHKTISRYIDDNLSSSRSEIKSQTTVSTIKAELSQVVKTEQDEEQLSQTSYAASTNNTMGTRVPLPPNGDAAFEGEPFSCPYCFNIIQIRSRMDWKRHVFSDLRPYVCTFRDCPKADELYGSQREWFDHEVQLHRREWCCDICSDTFSQKTLFQEHIKVRHPVLVTKGHFNAVISMCERAVVTDICPLCGTMFTIHTLKKHLGLHLQEIALFVLPRPEEDRSEIKSEQSGCSIESLDEYLSRKPSFEFNPDSNQPVGNLSNLLPAATEEDSEEIKRSQYDGFDGFGDDDLPATTEDSELNQASNDFLNMDIEVGNTGEVYESFSGAHGRGIETATKFQEDSLSASIARFECHGCSRTFSTKNNLARHRRNMHTQRNWDSLSIATTQDGSSAIPGRLPSSAQGMEEPANLIPVRWDCPYPHCKRKGKCGFSRRDNLVQHCRGIHNTYIPKRTRAFAESMGEPDSNPVGGSTVPEFSIMRKKIKALEGETTNSETEIAVTLEESSDEGEEENQDPKSIAKQKRKKLLARAASNKRLGSRTHLQDTMEDEREEGGEVKFIGDEGVVIPSRRVVHMRRIPRVRRKGLLPRSTSVDLFSGTSIPSPADTPIPSPGETTDSEAKIAVTLEESSDEGEEGNQHPKASKRGENCCSDKLLVSGTHFQDTMEDDEEVRPIENWEELMTRILGVNNAPALIPEE